ncbi:ParA family protein [Kurthia sp. Dielmo]|uniref:ParA family protein n=1 Tax=Kurthia sp. Dielmo TaxID=1033738 RepID=UPI0011200549|nr:ParA family protein [Kurthia sp. Dielmo]
MTTTITFGNIKGGVGKTTNTVMIAYELAKMGKRVLIVDQDPQANATSLLMKTRHLHEHELMIQDKLDQVLDAKIAAERAKHEGEDDFDASRVKLSLKEINQVKESVEEPVDSITYDGTLMTAIQNQDLQSIITPIIDNLDIIPSYSDFRYYSRYLEGVFPDYTDRVTHLKDLLDRVSGAYDFVFIDVPPTLSIITDSALYASNYLLVVLQTQDWSLDGAKDFVGYLQELIDEYDAEADIIGILPVILKRDSKVDERILQDAAETFGEHNLFNSVVPYRERLKRYSRVGISHHETDTHDKAIHTLYAGIANELLNRIEAEEKAGVE